jgi:hypothetical protein
MRPYEWLNHYTVVNARCTGIEIKNHKEFPAAKKQAAWIPIFLWDI